MEGGDVQGGERDRFGLVTSKSLDKLLAICVDRNVIFRTVVRRIQNLLETEALRDASLAVQVETEVEIDELLQEIETSVYGSSDLDTVQSQEFGDRIRVAVEAGIVQIPRQSQFVRGLHERLAALSRRLFGDLPVLPNTPEERFSNWEGAWGQDQRDQVAYFQNLFEFEPNSLQLDLSVAKTLQSEFRFWLKRPEELVPVPELRVLMDEVNKLVGEASLLETLEEVEVSVKPDNEDWKIPSHGIRVNFHGGGGVYRGEWLDTPVDVRKVIDPDHGFYYREARLWAGLSHPNIVNLMGACESEKGELYFVTEPGEFGSLVKYLKTHPNEAWRKLHEVALALEFLHERGIVHAGIKPDNIRIGHDKKAKLTGFERSMTTEQLKTEEALTHRSDYTWHAPELLSEATPTSASDVYSLPYASFLQ